MGGDDGQARKRGGDRVQTDRPRVIQPDALPAGLARTDTARPGVEEKNQPQVFAALVQGPVLFIVGCERLQRWVQLHSLQAELADAVELGDGAVALQRVDTAKA